MSLKQELIKDADMMEDICIRTSDTCDMWQNHFIYAMAKAILHIITYLVKYKGGDD